MLEFFLLAAKAKLGKYLGNEKGEGMVGWIVGAALTVFIVVTVHGFVDGWIEGFWQKLSKNIDDIIG